MPLYTKSDSLKLSRKNPLSSGNALASTSITSDISNLLKVNGMNIQNQNMINVFEWLVVFLIFNPKVVKIQYTKQWIKLRYYSII
jgi:hypothetical protein